MDYIVMSVSLTGTRLMPYRLQLKGEEDTVCISENQMDKLSLDGVLELGSYRIFATEEDALEADEEL